VASTRVMSMAQANASLEWGWMPSLKAPLYCDGLLWRSCGEADGLGPIDLSMLCYATKHTILYHACQ